MVALAAGRIGEGMADPRPFALVVIETSHAGQLRDINSVRDAAEMLLGHWPQEGRGMAYRAARRMCLDALEGNAAATSARNSFIRAAEEADILVRAG